MANVITRSAKPLQVQRKEWGDYYTGTMQQLVETGKFKPEWFPGMPGNLLTRKYLKKVCYEGRTIPSLYITRKDSRRRRFTVLAYVDDQERELRTFQDRFDRARAKSMERASSWLRSAAKSKEEFLAMNIYSVKKQMALQVDWMKSNAGYSLSDDSMARLHAAVDAMAQEIKCFDVHYSPDEHEECRRRLAVDAFENQGLGKLIDSYPDLGIDREAEKAKFVAEALAIPVEGYHSAAIGKYMSLF